MTTAHGGARLMIGFAGTVVDDALVQTLRRTEARSVILFARNLIDAEQTAKLTQAIRGLVDWPLVIAIDQEGGVVYRLEDGVTVFPGNMAIGRTYDPGVAKAVGAFTAEEMAACGFDLVLAPVVDLQVDPDNPIVGFRSFGPDRQLVAALAASFITGLNMGGCSACLKHFPGLGLATVDPHIGQPRIAGSLDELFDPHMAVFKDVLASQMTPPAVMTTHVLLPEVDRSEMATTSSILVRDILRQRLGFEGCIITDDLEMGGAQPIGSIGEVVVRAASAGHDLMPICHSHDLQLEAARALESALQDGRLDQEEHEQAIARIDALHRRQHAAESLSKTRGGPRLASWIARRALALERDPYGWKNGLPFQVWDVSGGQEQQREALAHALGQGEGKRGTVFLVDRPDRDETAPSQIESVWKRAARNVLFVVLGSPSDISYVPEDAPVLTAFGRTPCQLDAVAELLKGVHFNSGGAD